MRTEREGAPAAAGGLAGFQQSTFFGSLDGLRALSVLAVIWHHAGSGQVEGALAHAGAHGVTLFFAISGFLITTLLLRERARTGHIDLPAFYMRRALRIFPLYYAVLMLYVLLVWAVEKNSPAAAAFWRNLPYFLTYTSNLFVALEGRTVFYFSWSLAAEEQYYLIWPTLLRTLRTHANALFALGGVLLVTTILQAQDVHGFRNFPVAIVAGSFLAVMADTQRGWTVLSRCLGHRWCAPALLLALIGVVLSSVFPAPVPHLVAAVLVIACVLREDHALATVLQQPIARYWGKISYGMYMLHMLCRNVDDQIFRRLGHTPTALEAFVACVLLTTVVASLSYRYFEQPFLRMKSRFSR